MNSIFNDSYKRLNKSQKQAVDNIEGPVMVIAGPGTGKTTVLTLRIANIINKGNAPANGILAITYTDAGVKAMRQKLFSIIGNIAHEVGIYTFHSFASSIINAYEDHFIHLKGMKQMSDVDIEVIIKNIISQKEFKDLRPIGKPDAYVRSIISSIDSVKRQSLDPQMVKQHAEDEIKRIENDENSISSRGISKGKLKAEALDNIEKCKKTILFSEIYKKYEEIKIKENKLDFNDLIINLIKAFRSDELLLRLVQEQYLYIHVDEHQDTNDSQNQIIELIANFFDNPNVFIVGDEKQAIYRFQGASVENFIQLKKHWPSMKTISLDTNYRSNQNILDASFGLIENNYENDEYKDLRIALKGKHDKDNKIKLVLGEDVHSTENFLLNEIKSLLDKDNKISIAIITRRNKELDKIIRLFEKTNIPVSSERSIDIFHHPIGSLFFDLLSYINDPRLTDKLSKTILFGLWNIDFDNSIKIIKDIKSDKVSNIQDIIPSIKDINENLLIDSPINSIINIAKLSGYSDLIIKDPSYIQVWRGIVSLSESIIEQNDIIEPIELIKSLLAYRESAEERMIKVTIGNPESNIHIMTAHGSKGLEFDYVFLPYSNEENWITKNRGSSFVIPKKESSISDIKDLRRLFYVGMTRARQSIYILSSLEDNDGKILTPLRFIQEIPKDLIENIKLNRLENNELINKLIKIENSNKDKKLLDIVKNSLINSGLSVTALNHFINCPNTFIYQSILKVPQPFTVSSEKGNAMHEAISKVWILENKSQKNIEETLNEYAIKYINNSYLDKDDKERVKQELQENIPDITKSLLLHFNKKGDIYTEHWTSHNLTLNINNKDITIPIHGKLDCILDEGNIVNIFDYKTKKAMSVSSIKGETKNDNGDYFRQLVFYDILLSNNSKFKTKKIIPSLVFISPDEKGNCSIVNIPILEKDKNDILNNIKILVESVWSGEILKSKCDDRDCVWCGLQSIDI